MNMTKRTLALALALAMGLSALTGCGGRGDNSGNTSGSSSASGSGSTSIEPMDLTGVTDPYLATAGLSEDTVVAQVGDIEITSGELLYWLYNSIQYQFSQYGSYATDLPWDLELESGATLSEQLKSNALDTAVLYSLMPTLAEQEGISVTQETLDQLDSQNQQIIERLGSEALAEHYFWSQMLTWDLLSQQNQRSDLYLQLQDLYFGEESGSYPTDAEVLAFAQDELGVYRAKHILLMTIDPSTGEALDETTIAEKKTQADDLLAQLRAAEDPIALFDQLMNEHSEDSGLATNPDGYTTYKGQMVAPFEEGALALKAGEISDVVESDFGYHIILRLPLDPADYRHYVLAQRMQDKVSALAEAYGVETTDAYDQIDLADFWSKMLSMQSTVLEEVQEAILANPSGSDDTGSDGGDASSSAG